MREWSGVLSNGDRRLSVVVLEAETTRTEKKKESRLRREQLLGSEHTPRAATPGQTSDGYCRLPQTRTFTGTTGTIRGTVQRATFPTSLSPGPTRRDNSNLEILLYKSQAPDSPLCQFLETRRTLTHKSTPLEAFWSAAA